MPKPAAAAGRYITRFPSRPHPTNPTTTSRIRVRENQRRHRARTKSHLAALEVQLASTRHQLHTALARIQQLTAEVETFRRGGSKVDGDGELTSVDEVVASRGDDDDDEDDGASTPPYLSTTTIISESSGDMQLPTSPFPSSSSSSSTDFNTPVPTLPNDDCHCDCTSLPPPSAGESTTPCTTAFDILSRQNRRGLDLSSIKHWLRPGFRGGVNQNDGACRVETRLLFGLIDHILV